MTDNFDENEVKQLLQEYKEKIDTKTNISLIPLSRFKEICKVKYNLENKKEYHNFTGSIRNVINKILAEEYNTDISKIKKLKGYRRDNETAIINYNTLGGFKENIASSDNTIAEAAKKVLKKAGKAIEIKEIYDSIMREGLYDFGALDPVSALRVALDRRCINGLRSDAPREKWFIRYPNQVYGLIEWEQNENNSNKQKYSKNLILYGPPGTGKTFITKQKAVEIIEHD